MKRFLRILAVVVALNVVGGVGIRHHTPGVCWAHSSSIPPPPDDDGDPPCSCWWRCLLGL